MPKEVFVTPEAEADLNNITGYLFKKFGVPAVNNFLDRYDEVITTLSERPGSFQFIDFRKQVQKCVLTKHNIIYFIETMESVKIITIFDTRQDPEKLSSFI